VLTSLWLTMIIRLCLHVVYDEYVRETSISLCPSQVPLMISQEFKRTSW